MQVTELHTDGTGIAELDGARHVVDLSLIDDPGAGDYVIVHAGFAIERLDEAEANTRLDLFAQLAADGEGAATSRP
jgi:hydrogenase expression/formation protein HypC